MAAKPCPIPRDTVRRRILDTEMANTTVATSTIPALIQSPLVNSS